MYVGIENHSEQGLRSLGRAVTIDQNERALELVRERGLFAAFNLLLFDPDTTMGSLDANIGWLERCADVPFNFCTTQVYAGTPLESRLLAEGRLRGSYLGRVYAVADPRAEVMARLVNVAFHQRTLDHDGMAAQNMQLRLELEVLRRFHPEAVGAELVAAVHQFSRAFGIATAAHLRAAHRFVGGVSLRDGDAIRAFTVTLAKRIHHEDFDLLHDLRRLRKAMATPIAATPNRAR